MKNRAKEIVMGIVFLTILAGNTVMSKQNAETIDVDYKNIRIMVNDEEVVSDAEPFIYNGRTYVPARAVAESLGGTVEWDAENSIVKVSENKLYEKEFLKEMVIGMNLANELWIYSWDLESNISQLVEYRNYIVVGEPSNIDDVLSGYLQQLNDNKEFLSDSLKKDFENLIFYTKYIFDSSEIEKIKDDFNHYSAIIENIYSAYNSLYRYKDTKDPIYLQEYATYYERAKSQTNILHNNFLDLKYDFYYNILNL